MEERKLIKFGKSAYCITLPHAWLKKNQIAKGDAVAIQETMRNSLEVIPTNLTHEEKHELTLDISEKTTSEIIQLLLAAYLNGYNTIILQGPNAGKITYVRKHVHEFIAAEIMEATSNKIVINIFWDVKSINLQSIITRIGHITRSIFAETIEMMDEEINSKDIIEKGFEVQRQVLLARRSITYALNNSATAQKFNLSSLELLYISYIIYFFGSVGEYIVKTARILTRSKVGKFKDVLADPGKKNELTSILRRLSEYYSKVLEAHNMRREHPTKFVFTDFVDLEESINDFRAKNPMQWTALLAEYLKMLMLKIKEIENTMINMEAAPK